MGRHNKTRVEHELFDDPLWAEQPFAHLKPMAEAQLGTVGSGNHYVDIFVDEVDRVWVGVHFGSRGLGHKTATYFLKKAGGKDGMDVAPAVVRRDSDLGRAYLAGMNLAGRYAYAGREYVARHVVTNMPANRAVAPGALPRRIATTMSGSSTFTRAIGISPSRTAVT